MDETARDEYTVAFTAGDTAYVLTGIDNQGIFQNDMWAYVAVNNNWIPRASLTAPGRSGAIAFSINGKGYAGTGFNGTTYLDDFWEYDPATDTWAPRADFAGTPRYVAAAFAIGSKGYVGTGKDTAMQLLQDFWEYDAPGDSWFQLPDFPGTPRHYTDGFAMKQFGYIGAGLEYKNDYWRIQRLELPI